MPNTMRYFCEDCGVEIFTEEEIKYNLCDDCEDEDGYVESNYYDHDYTELEEEDDY